MTNRTSGQVAAPSQRRRQLARPDQQVVDETGATDGPDPAPDVVAQQPIRIGLVVDLVADPDQAVAAGTLAELGERRRRRRVASGRPSRRRRG